MGASMGAEAGFEFTVRESTRARRVRLTVTAREGLVVVVPVGWRGDAGSIVRSKGPWVSRALASVAEKRAQLLAGLEGLLPSDVSLRAVGRTYRVEYGGVPGIGGDEGADAPPQRGRSGSSRGAGVTCRVVGETLVLAGDVESPEACRSALLRWLDRQAREHLPRLLDQEATRTGLVPARVRMTSARTRWGSCSARGTVSLNRNLLFLPPELARALVLHELAHLEILNHSPRFWSRLAVLDPHALEHRARLKDASAYVPLWIEA